MKRLTGPGVVPTGEMVLPMIWNRLKDIENILGDDYDLQRLEQLLVALLAVARGGGVFDAEDELAAVVPGVGPVEQHGADEADVGQPRG